MSALQEAELQHLRGMKALVVDDNPTNRRILEGMLQNWGMRPHTVGDGEEALLELLAAQESGDGYALVLTDRHMMGMDGLTLIARIRRWERFGSATIVMLTSTGLREDQARCRQLNVSAYLSKPIRQTELREAICRVLGTLGAKSSTLLGGSPPPAMEEPEMRERRTCW